jgi:hypothetical protein
LVDVLDLYETESTLPPAALKSLSISYTTTALVE